MFEKNLINKAQLLFELALKNKVRIVTAESCTGGLLAALITEIPGSSAILERGFVTYSNLSKAQMLGVDKNILEEFGAVSFETAKEMALGAIKNSQANLSLAITGIAGPDGGSEEKPVGLVHIASYLQLNEELINQKFYFSGKRNEIRISSISNAMDILINQINQIANQ